MTNTVLAAIFGTFAFLLLVWGYGQRAKRASLWLGAVSAGSAAGFAYFDGFWAMVVLGTLAVWCLIASLNAIDFGWRMRFGLVVSTITIAFIAFWPSLSNITKGAIPCPEYIRKNAGNSLVAGLDISGGLRLVYTVDVREAVKDRRDRYYDDLRGQLAKAYKLHEGTGAPSEEAMEKLREKVKMKAPRREVAKIEMEFPSAAEASAKVDPRLRQNFRELEFVFDGKRVTAEVLSSAETEIRQTAVEQAKKIVLRRIDELGLTQAAVSIRDEDIIIEVPGSTDEDFDKIRSEVSKTARLEFKMTDDASDYFAKLQEQSKVSAPEGLQLRTEAVPDGLTKAGEKKTTNVTTVQLTIQEDETAQEALKRLKGWVELLELPPDREIGYEKAYSGADPVTGKVEVVGWRTHLLKSRTEITGDMITDAQAAPQGGTSSLGGWVVNVNFTQKGGSVFCRITGPNVNRRFAILLDDEVVSTPVIQVEICGGSSQITMGAGNVEEQLKSAKELERFLRAGALPAPISLSNEQRIGPSLGRDSIQLGVEGALGGGLLVLLFMILYYRRAGIIANISVATNLFLQLAILAAAGASMTLPGIAGLALTVGMSVDSNVLINERIREELRADKTPRAALELGYARALSAIVDGHLTTFISAVVLMQYGTGPIKGFATTLLVGTVTSIFSGVIVSRVLFDLWVRGFGRRTSLDMG